MIIRVKQDRDAAFVELPGDPSVIGVSMRQHDRRDVVEPAADLPQRRLDLVPVAGHAGVHDRHPASVGDKVEVDALAAEPVDARRELDAHSP